MRQLVPADKLKAQRPLGRTGHPYLGSLLGGYHYTDLLFLVPRPPVS